MKNWIRRFRWWRRKRTVQEKCGCICYCPECKDILNDQAVLMSNKMAQEKIDKQWPGFVVTCKCGSAKVELENSMGWSELSGGWGAISLVCHDCDNRTEIFENM